jgi:hypothetical protein
LVACVIACHSPIQPFLVGVGAFHFADRCPLQEGI